MAFVSITRLRVRSIFYLFRFMRSNEASAKQLMATEGLIAGKELMDKGLVFWTLTVWKEDGNMRSFRNSPAHKKAMQKLPYWCNEASYFHWTQEGEIIPDWLTASQKLLTEGKSTKVRNPSARQLVNSFPPVQWKRTGRIFK